MKQFILTAAFAVITFSTSAQVGIGTITPDASSALDVFSNSKGLLMPRLTTVERDNISLPATGLMIYNSTLNDGEINTGTPNDPIWKGMKAPANPASFIESVSAGNNISTEATSYELISGMSITPAAGTYLALFNAQISSNQTFSSEQGITDVNAIYNQIVAKPGGVPHALVFGNNEILVPGVYDVVGAPSIAGTLTLDGVGNPNSLFVIRGTGAFTTGASTTMVLINGADANNIFWLSEAAMSTGASTIIKGNLISKGAAIALGAGTNLRGGMFSTIGALTMGADSVVTVATGSSHIDFGVLGSFAMFTASGGISGCPTCTITGDVGTGAGAPTAFEGLNGNIFPPGTTSVPNTSTYAIFKNGLEVADSARTIVVSASVSLQTVVEVSQGESVDVRWRVTSGGATLHHRILSLLRSGN